MRTGAETSPDDRAVLVVRLATRAFGDGVRAADWLAQANDLFAGQAPLTVARSSVAGCANVVQVLDDMVALRSGY
jgi:hypothetical protein